MRPSTLLRPSTLALVWLCFKKDLVRRRRAPLAVLIMLAFPLLFSGGMAVVFGSDDDEAMPRVHLLVEDRDGSVAGEMLLGAFQSDEMAKYLDVEKVGPEGRERMEKGEASALLVIPEQTTKKLLRNEQVRFELVRNPAQGVLPEIAEQMSVLLTDVLSIGVRAIWAQAEAAGFEIEELRDFDSLEVLDLLSDADFAKIAVAMRHTYRVMQDYLDEPPIGFEKKQAGAVEEDEDDDTPVRVVIFLIILPGISVYALFVIGDQSMRDVLVEATAGTLRRQVIAPTRVAHLLAGKVLVTMVVASLALAVLASVAAFVVPNPVNVPGFVGLAFAVVLSVAGISALIYGLAGDEQRGSSMSGGLYVLLAFSSGSFIPLDNLPAAMRQVAPVSPFYWGTVGFRDLLNEATFGDVLPSILTLTAIGVVGLAIGSWRLHRLLVGGKLS